MFYASESSEKFKKLKPIRKVYGVLFNAKGEIVIVKINNKWLLPGGAIEKGEDAEKALIREVNEEADVEIEEIRPAGYQKVIVYENKKKRETFYQLRYAAKISNIKKQTPDPAVGYIPERKFIKPKDFLKYCPWGNIGKAIVKNAVEVMRKK